MDIRWGYRLWQGVMRLRALVSPPDATDAQRLLSAEAWALFRGLSAGDRAHSLRVLNALRQRGVSSTELLQAALLHDVGKAEGRLTLVHRTFIVCLRRLKPGWLVRLANPQPDSWRYPFYVYLRHAELGAERCAQAGCSPAVVALVRHHEKPLDQISDAALRAGVALLAEADDRC
ncbi:MAG: hypothetical protein H5T69_13440 [Chloroflexi bacterium]|nr:hypothetical protein [Chloroflexota bacterium]